MHFNIRGTEAHKSEIAERFHYNSTSKTSSGLGLFLPDGVQSHSK